MYWNAIKVWKITQSARSANRAQITHKSPKRHKKDTQAGKWTLLLHISAYSGHRIISHTFFLCPPLATNDTWHPITFFCAFLKALVKRMQHFIQHRATLLHATCCIRLMLDKVWFSSNFRATSMKHFFCCLGLFRVGSRLDSIRKRTAFPEYQITNYRWLWALVFLFAGSSTKDFHPTIKFTAEISDKEVTFRDTIVCKGARFDN